MTKEEVAAKLKQYLDSNTIEDITGNEGIAEAISIAIEVLEQQEVPMKTVALELTEEEYQRILQQMKTAPLIIEPEQKKGEWLMKWNSFFHRELPVCSECGSGAAFKTKFCPCCGVEMENAYKGVSV